LSDAKERQRPPPARACFPDMAPSSSGITVSTLLLTIEKVFVL
jgi:hypothetical protein